MHAPARGPGPGQRRDGAAFGGRRGRRRRSCSPRPRSTSTTPRPCGRRPGRSSTCRRARASTTAEAIDAAPRRAGIRILAMDADGEDDLYETDLSGPVAFVFGNEAHGLPAEVIARWPTPRCASRIAGRAESLNLAAAATVCLFEWAPAPRAGQARGARVDHRGGRPRHPLAAHRDEGVRLRPREAVGADDRGPASADAAGDRARRRPDGHDPAAARRRGAGRGGRNLELFPEQRRRRPSWHAGDRRGDAT